MMCDHKSTYIDFPRDNRALYVSALVKFLSHEIEKIVPVIKFGELHR
jgi:hypothetical protein